MPTLLTPKQIEQIKRIVAKRHAAILLRVVGPSALLPDERRALEEAGIPMDAGVAAIRDSYLFGQTLAGGKPALSSQEQAAIKSAELHAGTHIRHLGARVVQQVGAAIFQEDAALRTRLQRQVQDATAQNVARRESVGKLKKQLASMEKTWERDWHRVALTEKTNALQQGQADSLRKDHGDPWVYKQPMPTACKSCVALHLDKDGLPKIFRLSYLEGNGSNVGKKQNEWQPVVGTIHPHCGCQLFRVPPGWGFDDDGDLVPGGTRGTRYEGGKPLAKSLMPELAAESSHLGNRGVRNGTAVNFVLGSPINNAGAMTRAATAEKLKEHLTALRGERPLILNPEAVYNWKSGAPAEIVHPVEIPDNRLQTLEVLPEEAEENREQLVRWKQRLVLGANVNTIVKAGPYIGPRGGMWADPEHTVPYKQPQLRIVPKAPPQPQPKSAEIEWKTGNPPGIPEVDWTSWAVGRRGGTEQLHWDEEKMAFKPERAKLHKQIVQKFFKQGKRFKKGSPPTAIVSMGGPASGKSSLLRSQFGDLSGFVRVDSDEIKNELPEYKEALAGKYQSAAEIVHTESTVIAQQLLEASVKAKKNMIFDTTGADFPRLSAQINRLRAAGYRVAVIMPHVPTDVAKERAKVRAKETGRWIPEAAIDDVYQKVPSSFVQALPLAEVAYVYDNSGDAPRVIFEKSGEAATVHDEEAAKNFPGLVQGASMSKADSDLLALLRSLASHTSDVPVGEKVQIQDVSEFRDWISLLPASGESLP